MEDAVQALKMAFAVFVFVIALSISFLVLSQAKATSEIVFYTSDKTNYYDNVKSDTDRTARIVGLETVIPTLYRYYREDFAVQIMDGDKVLQLFDTTIEAEVSNAAKVIANRRNDRQRTLINLYGNENDAKYMHGAPWIGTTDEDAKARIDLYIKGEKGYINNALVDYTRTGLFKQGITNNTQFKEIFTEYQFSGSYITEIDGEKLEAGDELVDDMQGSKKILITYEIIEK